MKYETLIHVLSVSQRRNGNIPITIGHLLNIIKLCDKIEEQESLLEGERLSEEYDIYKEGRKL